jgi:hypothetical protein
MTPNNLDFLNTDLKYLGFGERSLLNQHLEAQLLRELPAFELFTEAFYDADTKLEAKLCFTRSTKGDFYFFNKYEALLRYSGDPDKDRGQTFYISKGHGFTLKESFNLLQGRAVHKLLTSRSGIQYTAWVQLNFTEKDRNDNYLYTYYRGGKFDLVKALKEYPIRELDYEEMQTNLCKSLERGNLHQVTFKGAEKLGKYLVEANPLLQTINIYPAATRVAGVSPS